MKFISSGLEWGINESHDCVERQSIMWKGKPLNEREIKMFVSNTLHNEND